MHSLPGCTWSSNAYMQVAPLGPCLVNGSQELGVLVQQVAPHHNAVRPGVEVLLPWRWLLVLLHSHPSLNCSSGIFVMAAKDKRWEEHYSRQMVASHPMVGHHSLTV